MCTLRWAFMPELSTQSKSLWGCAGHAGSRMGWALVGDPAVAKLMRSYLQLHGGLPSESQARAAALLEYVLSTRGGSLWGNLGKLGLASLSAPDLRDLGVASLSAPDTRACHSGRAHLQGVWLTCAGRAAPSAPLSCWSVCSASEVHSCCTRQPGLKMKGPRVNVNPGFWARSMGQAGALTMSLACQC